MQHAVSDHHHGTGLAHAAQFSLRRHYTKERSGHLRARGRAGLYMPIYHNDDTVNVYEHEIELVDDLKPGDVAVFSCGGNLRIAPGASS